MKIEADKNIRIVSTPNIIPTKTRNFLIQLFASLFFFFILKKISYITFVKSNNFCNEVGVGQGIYIFLINTSTDTVFYFSCNGFDSSKNFKLLYVPSIDFTNFKFYIESGPGSNGNEVITPHYPELWVVWSYHFISITSRSTLTHRL